MHGRFYGGHQVIAEPYNGEKYQKSKAENANDEKRLEEYEKWLEQGDEKVETQTK
jgi:hypothetical protein